MLLFLLVYFLIGIFIASWVTYKDLVNYRILPKLEDYVSVTIFWPLFILLLIFKYIFLL